MASSLTLVGLMRVSTGPAIRVMLSGVAGLSSSAMIATAASAWAQGWQTDDQVRAGTDGLEKRDDVGDIVVEAEGAVGQRRVAGVAPVGDVDVVVRQQGLDRAAQQGGEVAGQRRDQQDARLLGIALLAEAHQVAERRR